MGNCTQIYAGCRQPVDFQNSEAGSTQNDNAKHLYGAVRLIRRDAKEINPTIDLLGAFCLMFLGTNNNHLLQKN